MPSDNFVLVCSFTKCLKIQGSPQVSDTKTITCPQEFSIKENKTKIYKQTRTTEFCDTSQYAPSGRQQPSRGNRQASLGKGKRKWKSEKALLSKTWAPWGCEEASTNRTSRAVGKGWTWEVKQDRKRHSMEQQGQHSNHSVWHSCVLRQRGWAQQA